MTDTVFDNIEDELEEGGKEDIVSQLENYMQEADITFDNIREVRDFVVPKGQYMVQFKAPEKSNVTSKTGNKQVLYRFPFVIADVEKFSGPVKDIEPEDIIGLEFNKNFYISVGPKTKSELGKVKLFLSSIFYVNNISVAPGSTWDDVLAMIENLESPMLLHHTPNPKNVRRPYLEFKFPEFPKK